MGLRFTYGKWIDMPAPKIQFCPETTHQQLGSGFFRPVEAATFPQHQIRYCNYEAAASVGLEHLDDDSWIAKPLSNSSVISSISCCVWIFSTFMVLSFLYRCFLSMFCADMEFKGFLSSWETQALITLRNSFWALYWSNMMVLEMSIIWIIVLLFNELNLTWTYRFLFWLSLLLSFSSF